MRMKKRFLSMLVLLAAVATGAWAEESETINTATSGKTVYTGTHFKITASLGSDSDGIILWNESTSGTATIEALNGENITKIEMHMTYGGQVATNTTTTAGKLVATNSSGNANDISVTDINATSVTIGTSYNGVTWININKFVIYYGAAPTTYSVTLAEGTEEADKWTVKVGEGEAQAFPIEGLDGGETVIATYSGDRKVKSVKAVKKAASNAYLKWDADQKKLVATEMPAEVTTVASADADVTWEAGTYVVEGEVNISGTITLSGDVNLIIKDDATLTAQRISGNSKNLSIYGQANQTGELVVNNSGNDAINGITTFEVHSAKVTSTSSGNNRGGFYYIGTFNVYGGLVDAKNTAEDGGYGIGMNGGFMNIYGGEVKAEGKGDNAKSNGIHGGDPVNKTTVTVYGGKLWAGNADDKALRYVTLTIDKSLGFNGEIETSPDNSTWNPTVGTPDEKYVRVGYN